MLHYLHQTGLNVLVHPHCWLEVVALWQGWLSQPCAWLPRWTARGSWCCLGWHSLRIPGHQLILYWNHSSAIVHLPERKKIIIASARKNANVRKILYIPGGPKKSLWCDLEEKCLGNSKIFFDEVFLSVYSHLLKKLELSKLSRKKVMGL